jgi:hypothetical protein
VAEFEAAATARSTQDTDRIRILQQELSREETSRRTLTAQLEESRRQYQTVATESARTARDMTRLQGALDDAKLTILRLEQERRELMSLPPAEPKTVEKVKVCFVFVLFCVSSS